MNKIILEEIKNEVEFKDNEYVIIKEKDMFNFKINGLVKINLFNEEDINSNYVFNVYDDSNLIINLFDACSNSNRKITVNLEGINSKVILNLSSISTKENTYEVNIYHNNKNTSSLTNIHGLTIDNNKIYIKNNGYIKKGSSNSKLDQDNKIIIMNKNNSKIEPNLFIDEYDVKASHGAYIGKFNEEELFYLNSRGLNDKDSYNLLINGFLLYEFDISDEDKNKLIDIIKKYWR